MADDPVLTCLRPALVGLYGSRLERVLHPLDDRRAELDRLADLRVHFLDGTDAFIDVKPYPGGACRDAAPLMHEIRRGGLEL